MANNQTTKVKKSSSERDSKYTKLQKKRRKIFYSSKKLQQKQQRSKKKRPLPRWPINVDSIRLPKKKKHTHTPPTSSDNTDDTTISHTDRVLDISLEKLYTSLNTITTPQYKSSLDDAVDNATTMIYDVMKEIGKTEQSLPPPSSQYSNKLGYEDILLAALGANVPPIVIQRALKRMKRIVPLSDKVTEQIIDQACSPPDIFGTAGKSLASMESIYGFVSPLESVINESLLYDEAELYKIEPKYMASLQPSSSNVTTIGGTVEQNFLNMNSDKYLPLPPSS